MKLSIEIGPNTRQDKHPEKLFLRITDNGKLVAKGYANDPTQAALVVAAYVEAHTAKMLQTTPKPAQEPPQPTPDPEPQEESGNSIEDILDALTGLDEHTHNEEE